MSEITENSVSYREWFRKRKYAKSFHEWPGIRKEIDEIIVDCSGNIDYIKIKLYEKMVKVLMSGGIETIYVYMMLCRHYYRCFLQKGNYKKDPAIVMGTENIILDDATIIPINVILKELDVILHMEELERCNNITQYTCICKKTCICNLFLTKNIIPNKEFFREITDL